MLALVTAPAGAEPEAGDAALSAPRAALRVLSAEEFDRYLAALPELMALGLDAGADVEGSLAQQRAAASQMQDVLGEHGFDAQSFNDVHWNVVMAYLGDALSTQNDELAKAQAQQLQQLEEMKDQMPPEQYEAAAQAMQAMLPALSAVATAPEANRKLVAEHRAELDALFDDAGAKP
jgi:hypothetical protein